MLHIILILINIFGLISTGSRTGFIAFVFIAAYYTIKFINNKNFRSFLLITVFLFLIYFLITDSNFLNVSVLERFSIRRIFISNNDGFNGRIEIWNSYLQILFENPLRMFIGHGIGSTNIGLMNNFDISRSPHNVFIELFFEIGLIGLILFLFILYKMILNSKKHVELKTLVYISLIFCFSLGIFYDKTFWNLITLSLLTNNISNTNKNNYERY